MKQRPLVLFNNTTINILLRSIKCDNDSKNFRMHDMINSRKMKSHLFYLNAQLRFIIVVSILYFW